MTINCFRMRKKTIGSLLELEILNLPQVFVTVLSFHLHHCAFFTLPAPLTFCFTAGLPL